MNPRQALVGAGTLLLGAGIVAGATQISADAGYGGVGPNFLPWVVGLALIVCGGFLVREAATGGFRALYDEGGGDDAPADWVAFAWMTAGILLNALLITTVGFILSCALCFLLAECGLRHAQGRLSFSPAALLKSAAIGIAVSAPVYWMFTKALAINLPGLTDTGWL
ncbi:MAG: tripartite tricarboxylate transporter TctB family protein [Burkholderiales bacterium]|jgi:putative tricarboxylic transport membrane protein|nr:tripartite tricarboxylate transporter TctB family protein [Burkholderiales bacterium]